MRGVGTAPTLTGLSVQCLPSQPPALDSMGLTVFVHLPLIHSPLLQYSLNAMSVNLFTSCSPVIQLSGICSMP